MQTTPHIFQIDWALLALPSHLPSTPPCKTIDRLIRVLVDKFTLVRDRRGCRVTACGQPVYGLCQWCLTWKEAVDFRRSGAKLKFLISYELLTLRRHGKKIQP